MLQVIKRDGKSSAYYFSKIFKAVLKCGLSENQATIVTENVDASIIREHDVISVEMVQDMVEHELMSLGFHSQAKAYILYRAERNKKRIPHVQQKTDSYVVHYPEAVEFADTQAIKFMWHHTEIDVNKDVQDLRVNMTEAEKHGVIEVLKLFVLYELRVGNDYWLGRFRRMFPRPEFQRKAATFGFTELQVHAPFYDKVNKALFLDTEEFYTAYQSDDLLVARMQFISDAVNNSDDLVSLAAFSMVEGVVLFSSFAFLKSFQSNGKNKIANIVAGINFSVRDEDLHHQGGAWAFRILHSQKNLTPEAVLNLDRDIRNLAEEIAQHEFLIIERIFAKGDISNVTAEDLKSFVLSRIDYCLNNLGIAPIYHVGNNPIAEWFYKSTTGTIFHDFFSKVGREYTRDWDKKKLIWAKDE